MANHRIAGSAVVVIGILAASQLVTAQPAAQPERERHGVFGGVGLYGGNISCDGSDCGGFRAAGGGSGHIGYMFGPRFGALLDVWGMTSRENNVTLTFISSTLGVRYWVVPVIWIHGGVGGGHAVFRIGGASFPSDDIPVGHLGIGFEVVRGRSWALTVEARVAQGTSTEDNGGVQTGRSAGVGAAFTWFAYR